MFKIYLRNPEGDYPIYEPLDDEMRVFKPTLTQEMGKGEIFEFYMMTNHPNADKLKLLKSEVIVYEDKQEIFRGRVLNPRYDIGNMIDIVCEGDYVYLMDSQQKPFDFDSDIPGFIAKLLEVHNSQVDDYKKILPGRITVTDTGRTTHRHSKDYANTKDILRTQLRDVYGGYFRVRNEGGKKYLDYVWDYGGENEQVIRYGVNLLTMDKSLNASNIITCLIPLGTDVEYRDEIGEKQTKPVDITSVNGGLEYIQDDEGIEKYGKVWGTYRWNEVTKPEDLLAKAKQYLQEAAGLPMSITLSAIDMSVVDEDEKPFKLGRWTQIVSRPHGIDRKMLLTKKVTDLLDPTAGSITLGKPDDTASGTAVKNMHAASAAVDKVAQSASSEINRKVENATNLITGGLGGYVVLDNIDPNTGEKIHPWRILIMNTPDKATAKNVIQFNQNGIGFSTTGINGPYTNAWTIDGNLVADFITTGTLLADRVRGGTLEVGGSGLGRDGRIVVRDASDRQIGYWDNTGMHILRGTISGTTIDVGPLYADEDEVGIGDYSVSANGKNQLLSANGWVKIDSNERPAGSPGGGYASLKIGGLGYGFVTINGTGMIECGSVDSIDVYASKCNLSQGSSRSWGLGETIDWFWDEFQKLKNRVDGAN